MNWDLIADIILATALAVLAVFSILGLCQWIKRKSLKKVDKPLLAMFVPLLLMVIVYVIFEKFIILNYRPDGSGEVSFPSTHTMVTATIFACVALMLPQYIKNKSLIVILDVIMVILTALVSVGRVFANKHWTSDVIGGLAFAIFFATIYYLIIRSQNAKRFHKNH